MAYGKKIRYLLFVIGTLILLYFVINSRIIDNIQVIFNIKAYPIAIAFSLSILNIVLKIQRWNFLSRHFNQPVSWRDASVVTISSFFYANITPGKIGDLFKAYYMREKFGMSLPNGISMIFYERFFEFVILFLFALLIILKRVDDVTLIALQFSAILIGMLVLFYYRSDSIMAFVDKLSSKLLGNEKLKLSFSIQKISCTALIVTFFITFLSLVCEIMRLWFVIYAFDYNLSLLDLAMAFSISIIIGLISQIPLGIGAMEGSLSVLLERMGIPAIYSVPMVLVDRTLSMYFALLIGYLVSCISWREIGRVEAAGK